GYIAGEALKECNRQLVLIDWRYEGRTCNVPEGGLGEDLEPPSPPPLDGAPVNSHKLLEPLQPCCCRPLIQDCCQDDSCCQIDLAAEKPQCRRCLASAPPLPPPPQPK